MSDPTKRAISGAPLSIPAAAFNSFVDTATARKRARAQATTSSAPDTREGLILVRNDSGHDVDRFGILGIADILIEPSANLAEFQNRPAISGATPTTADFTGLFVVTAEPIAKGKLGRAFVFGVCPVLVNVVSAGDGFADVKNNDRTQLDSSATSGAAQILWMEDITATGQMWCLVRLGNQGNATRVTLRIFTIGTRPGSYFVERVTALAPSSSGTDGFTNAELANNITDFSEVAFNRAETTDTFGSGVGWIVPVGTIVEGIPTGVNDDGVNTFQFWAIGGIACGELT